ncbi:hypothetical protein QTP86_005302 [Hemibagrus guttatus]|nr:hypothetical protein QTP86_005302 [Hemibagrus guttatus]
MLRECAEQLTDIFTDIFNISLNSAVVPTCLKTMTIVPVPKKSTVSCLNDYHPVALTPIVMKCFKRLIMRHIKTQIPPALDPLQFGIIRNRSTDDAIITTLHLSLTHLDNKDTYVRLQGGMVAWCLARLPHTSRVGGSISASAMCVWSVHVLPVPREFPLDFSSAFNTIIPQHLIEKLSLLGLNTSLCNWILDFLTGTKFLGVHLAENFTWSLNTTSINSTSPPPILTMFYRGTIESVLSSCITAWFGNCTVSDRKVLQQIVRTAEKIIGVSLPSITDMYTTRCIRKANSIVDYPTHPSHTLFSLLPSGKRYRSIRALTTRLCNSFFPQAIRLLNTQN